MHFLIPIASPISHYRLHRPIHEPQVFTGNKFDPSQRNIQGGPKNWHTFLRLIFIRRNFIKY